VVDEGVDSIWPGEAETLEAEAVAIELAPDDRLSDTEPDSDESAEIDAPLTARVGETGHGDVGGDTSPSSVTDVQLPQTEVGASDVRAPLPPDEAIVDINGEQASDEHVEEPDPLVLLRMLPFPDDRSVGQVWIRRETTDDEWELAGSARASVGVPADAEIRVAVTQEGAADLSWLQAFEPSDLCALALDGVTLTIDQLAHVIRLTGLRELSLRDTGIDDRMLRTLQSLNSLDSLSLSGARVTGLGMLYLKPLTRLRTLDVSSTAVSGDGLVHLATLPGLESLCLAHTRVGDGAMVHLQRLTTLRQLDLRGTAVTAIGRQRIPAAVRVTPEALEATHFRHTAGQPESLHPTVPVVGTATTVGNGQNED
jgi:hypothetical protein